MKRLIFLLCLLLCTCSFGSCGMIYMDDSKEQKAYKDTITSLFDSLNNKDADTIYNLFSPSVREKDKDLKEQINKLLSVYNSSSYEIGWDGLLAGDASYEHGEKSMNAYTYFPVRTGDVYYWCYLDLMYENTYDEKQIGITQLDFYTADELCIMRDDEDNEFVESVGLNVYVEKELEEDVRCISGWPLKYSSTETVLDIEKIKEFFKNSNRYSDFKTQFGEPNAKDVFAYYELQIENEKPRYLELCVDRGKIISARVVDDYKYIETIYDMDEKN